MKDVTEQDVLAINCMAQHIRAFRDQAQNGMKADFSEPCSFCKRAKECTFDWVQIMDSVMKHGTDVGVMAPLER